MSDTKEQFDQAQIDAMNAHVAGLPEAEQASAKEQACLFAKALDDLANCKADRNALRKSSSHC